LSKKQGVETVAATFTDHLAVVLHIAINTTLTLRGRGHWRMNVSLLRDKNFQSIGKVIQKNQLDATMIY
jgi:hypothetical protein